jgi:hypothetical protein
VHDIEPIYPDATRGGQFSGRLRLTPEGVLQLAEDGHFLEIPRSKIDDKSKADTISKILVMTQVAWMAMQCITRKAYGLPLTLLEVHTMVHVVCAVLLFVLWIDVGVTAHSSLVSCCLTSPSQKPKDVQDPELLDISGFEDIIALMVSKLIFILCCQQLHNAESWSRTVSRDWGKTMANTYRHTIVSRIIPVPRQMHSKLGLVHAARCFNDALSTSAPWNARRVGGEPGRSRPINLVSQARIPISIWIRICRKQLRVV